MFAQQNGSIGAALQPHFVHQQFLQGQYGGKVDGSQQTHLGGGLSPVGEFVPVDLRHDTFSVPLADHLRPICGVGNRRGRSAAWPSRLSRDCSVSARAGWGSVMRNQRQSGGNLIFGKSAIFAATVCWYQCFPATSCGKTVKSAGILRERRQFRTFSGPGVAYVSCSPPASGRGSHFGRFSFFSACRQVHGISKSSGVRQRSGATRSSGETEV